MGQKQPPPKTDWVKSLLLKFLLHNWVLDYSVMLSLLVTIMWVIHWMITDQRVPNCCLKIMHIKNCNSHNYKNSGEIFSILIKLLLYDRDSEHLWTNRTHNSKIFTRLLIIIGIHYFIFLFFFVSEGSNAFWEFRMLLDLYKLEY